MYGTQTTYPNGYYSSPYSTANPYTSVSPVSNTSIFSQLAPKVLPGRAIDNVDEIMIGEVPQDGSLGVFPKKDGSCIYVKSWSSDGTIRTIKFVPSEQDDSVPRTEVVQEPQSDDITIETVNEKVELLLDLLTDPSASKSKDGVSNQNGSGDNKESINA